MTVVDAAFAVRIPEELPFDTATALLAQGLTALQLTRLTPLQGKAVLVTAAAGGVGSLTIQLAKRAGAKTVIGAASTAEKRDLVLSLGADAVVDYTKAGWVGDVRAATEGQGVGLAYDTTGGAITKASVAALAPFGQIVILTSSPDFGPDEIKSICLQNQTIRGFAIGGYLTPERSEAEPIRCSAWQRATSSKSLSVGGIRSSELPRHTAPSRRARQPGKFS